jgi:hypothetical protein
MNINRREEQDKHERMWIYLAVALYSPIIASLVRKIFPGQPAFLEPSSSAIILIIYFLSVKSMQDFPFFIRFIFIFWIIFQALYSAASVFYSWEIGAVAVTTRIIPVLSCFIAYNCIKTPRDLKKLACVALPVPLLLLPIGIICAIFGNKILPEFLQPLKRITDLGLDVSKDQFHAFAGVFSTQTHLAYSMFIIIFLIYATLTASGEGIKSRIYWYASACASILLAYLSTRRAVFIATIIGTISYLICLKRKVIITLIIFGVILSSGIYFLDVKSELHSKKAQTRTEALLNVDVWARIEKVFIGESMVWLWKAPFGSCLGCAGPEAQAFQMRIGYMEVGAQLLLAEIGILGFFLFIVSTIVPMIITLRKSKISKYRNATILLIIYQILFLVLFLTKSAKIVTQVSMAQIFFWASYGISISLIENEKNIKFRTIK